MMRKINVNLYGFGHVAMICEAIKVIEKLHGKRSSRGAAKKLHALFASDANALQEYVRAAGIIAGALSEFRYTPVGLDEIEENDQ